MSDSLLNLVDGFESNYKVFKSVFFEDSSAFSRLSAYLYTSRESVADAAKLRTCSRLVSDANDILDGFADDLLIPLTCYISFSDVPEEKLHNILNAYKTLKEIFIASPHLLLTACVIEDRCSAEMYYDISKRTKAMYDSILNYHPYLTGYDDISVCALYVISDKADNSALNEIELCTEKLKENLFFKDSTQALSHVLAFYEHPEKACERINLISKELKNQELNPGTSYTIVSLGTLAVSNEEPAVIVDKVKFVNQALKKKDGFTFLAISKHIRIMYSAFLTSLDYIKNNESNQQSHIMAHDIAVISAFSANIADSLKGETNI